MSVCVSMSVVLLHLHTAVLLHDSRPVVTVTIVTKSDCNQYVDVGQFPMDPQVKVKVFLCILI